MNESELMACRERLHERGLPADDWPDDAVAEIAWQIDKVERLEGVVDKLRAGKCQCGADGAELHPCTANVIRGRSHELCNCCEECHWACVEGCEILDYPDEGGD